MSIYLIPANAFLIWLRYTVTPVSVTPSKLGNFYHMTRNHPAFILSSLRTRRGWLELEVGCRLGSGGQSPRLRCHDFARPVSRGRASHRAPHNYRLCEWGLSRTGELVSVSRATNARSDTPVDRFDGPHTALVPVRTFFSNLPQHHWH